MGNVQMEARQIRYGDTNVEEALKTGGGGAKTLAGLIDTAIDTPSNGQILKYNAEIEKWENSSDILVESAEERIVGEWFGKPRYQKTIYTQSLINNGDLKIADLPDNIEDVVKIKTIFKIADDTPAWVMSNYYAGSNDQYRDVVYNGKIFLSIYTTRTAEIMAASKAWTTIQYTKTTDTLNSSR